MSLRYQQLELLTFKIEIIQVFRTNQLVSGNIAIYLLHCCLTYNSLRNSDQIAVKITKK